MPRALPTATLCPYTTLFRSHRYEEWYAVTWLRRKPQLQEDLVARKAEASDLKQQLDAATRAYKTQRDQLENQRKRSEEHTSELQSRENLVCRLLLEKKTYTV